MHLSCKLNCLQLIKNAFEQQICRNFLTRTRTVSFLWLSSFFPFHSLHSSRFCFRSTDHCNKLVYINEWENWVLKPFKWLSLNRRHQQQSNEMLVIHTYTKQMRKLKWNYFRNENCYREREKKKQRDKSNYNWNFMSYYFMDLKYFYELWSNQVNVMVILGVWSI